MAQNIFAAGMEAFDQSYDRQQQFGKDLASRQAGRALAGGDRAGAAQALGRAGNVDGVRTLQNDDARTEQQQYERGKDEASVQREQATQRAEVLKAVAGHLLQVPPGQRKAALQGAYPLFQAAQMDTSMFDPLSEDQLTDQGLTTFAGKVDEEIQAINLGNGGVGTFNKRTGAYKTEREPDHRPVIIGNGGVAVDPDTGQVVGRNPKTFAPQRARGAGGGGGAPPALPAGFVWEK